MAEKPDTHTALLRRVPLFAELAPEELQILAQCAVPRRYGRGEQVFGEGDPCGQTIVVDGGGVMH